MRGQATRGVARVKEEISSRVEKKSRGALQQRGTRKSTPIRVRMVYEKSNSDIHTV